MSDEDTKDAVLPILRNIQSDIAGLKTEMNARFDEVDLRFVKVEAKLEDVAKLARDTHSQLVDLAASLRLAERIADIEKRLEVLEAPKH